MNQSQENELPEFLDRAKATYLEQKFPGDLAKALDGNDVGRVERHKTSIAAVGFVAALVVVLVVAVTIGLLNWTSKTKPSIVEKPKVPFRVNIKAAAKTTPTKKKKLPAKIFVVERPRYFFVSTTPKRKAVTAKKGDSHRISKRIAPMSNSTLPKAKNSPKPKHPSRLFFAKIYDSVRTQKLASKTMPTIARQENRKAKDQTNLKSKRKKRIENPNRFNFEPKFKPIPNFRRL